MSEDTDGDPNTFTLNTPSQKIAAELYFVPGTLSRAFAKLEVKQIITRQKNITTLHDFNTA
ncbi:MAG TPA: hypothetical protein V6C71_19530 [Coleofasciculaceae cyanobacterium]